jgi:hypothetical protein
MSSFARVTSPGLTRPSVRPPGWADLLPCIGAAACTAAYGGLKLYWALGGLGGLREAPLPQKSIQEALARDSSAVAGHWISVVLAVVGIGAAIATVHPWGRVLPRWLLIGPLSALSALMILRAALQAIGDVQRLVEGVSPTSAHTARWDLALWSPYFLLWGILWGVVVYRFANRTRRAPVLDSGVE